MNNVNYVRVNLSQGRQRPWFALLCSAKAQQQFVAVLFDIRARVIFGEAEIKSLASISCGESAGTGGKTVNEPWKFVESWSL